MAEYYPRHLESELLDTSRDHPVVVLTGARQTGKTTLLRRLFPAPAWRFLDLDDLDQRDVAARRPEELLAGSTRIVIDEAQREPGILTAVKRLVDRDRTRVKVIVSGSANLLLMKRVSETLAGRAVHLILRPMTVGERLRIRRARFLPAILSFQNGQGPGAPPAWTPLAPQRLGGMLWRGGLPPLLHLRAKAVPRWWEGYVATYLERDVMLHSPLASIPDFRRVMKAVALRAGQLLNYASLARDVSVSAPTVRRYLDLLEATHMFIRLPAYAHNRTKRLIKSPKVYLADSGLAAFLAGDLKPESVPVSPLAGTHLEHAVLQELLAEAELMTPSAAVHYWRTSDNYEVDFVVEWGRQLVGVEVKRTGTPRYADASGLRVFLDENRDRAVCGVLLHLGRDIRVLGEKILALPVDALWRGFSLQPPG